MPALVRAAALTSFAELATRCGLNARALVAEEGLPTRCLSEPDLKVPALLVGRLLENAAKQAREPAFGLRLAESRRLSNLGPLALLVRDAPTLREALETLVRTIHAHNEAVVVQIDDHGGLVTVRTELSVDGAGALRQASELVVAVTCRTLQVLMGACWQPRLVCFTHAAPRSGAVHLRVLGPAVEFGHEFNGIVCNAVDLDTANPAADPVLARYSERLLASTLARDARMTDRVRQLVVLLLPRGLCRVEVVAQHLGIDRRTVHRQLAAESSSFSAVLESVRCELARRYVEGSQRPLLEVADLLGFNAASSFSRWYRGSFGENAARRRSSASPLPAVRPGGVTPTRSPS